MHLYRLFTRLFKQLVTLQTGGQWGYAVASDVSTLTARIRRLTHALPPGPLPIDDELWLQCPAAVREMMLLSYLQTLENTLDEFTDTALPNIITEVFRNAKRA